MAIYRDGIESHKGAVLKVTSHMWMDGMEEETAWVWNMETHECDHIQVGYYGCDGRNLMGRSYAKVDATEEVKRDIRRTLKVHAREKFSISVKAYKTEVRKGSHAEVIRGRKVPKGTRLEVFWVGDKPTYRSLQYHWMNETERIAGCYGEDGNKVWIKADYLKVIDKIKSPNAKERKKFIKAYVESNAREYGA